MAKTLTLPIEAMAAGFSGLPPARVTLTPYATSSMMQKKIDAREKAKLLTLRSADDNCLLNMAMNEFMKAAIRARPMPIDVFLLNCIVKSFCLPKRRCRFFPVNVSAGLVRSLAWSGSFIIRHSAAAADDAAVSRQPGWHLRGLTPGASALRTTPTPLRGLAWPWPVFCRRRPCPAGPVRQPGWVLRQHPGGGPPWGARLVRVWRAGQRRWAWPHPHSCVLSSSRLAPLRLARGHGWRSLRHSP